VIQTQEMMMTIAAREEISQTLATAIVEIQATHLIHRVTAEIVAEEEMIVAEEEMIAAAAEEEEMIANEIYSHKSNIMVACRPEACFITLLL
jgi:uncharacterized protein (DUF2336 family)